MVHRCKKRCHPDRDTSKCKNGFPFVFQDETDFDRREYPHHRRRSCGGHCPAGTRGGDLCVNQLIVEYSPRLLQLWDGHLNVKFAGNVDLFEYLYKYMFKGPDFARYTVGQENSVDEISDWLRGRYVCATEAAWRIFGFHTYDRHPSVVCLPVHAEGGDWVIFSEGDEGSALADTISQLQRYFYRPRRSPWLELRYREYFEKFVVTKTCGKTWKPYFPSLFTETSAPSKLSDVAPALDDAPAGKQFLVCPRVHGEPPLCRLQMKYPKQK